MTFRDHFSGHADAYSRARPTYPAGLFAWIASQGAGRRLAWDCGTGNGQAATGIAEHYDRVIGTDASEAQVGQAPSHPRIEWRVARETDAGLDTGTVDLVTVAQSLHWFDTAAFFAEARRVLAPGGVVAVWCYGLLRVTPQIDAIVERFYHEEVGPYWPPERRLVEEGYRSIPFPFTELVPPSFAMEARLNLTGLLDYIETWSAVQRYRKAKGIDPLESLRKQLLPAWGGADEVRVVRWPLAVRAGR